MTISSQTRKAGPFVGNDSTTAFPFAFKVFSAADMYVVKTDTDLEVETVLVLNTDYTVSLNADQNANPGGTITLPSALASGFTLTVTSNISPLQQTDLTNQGGFYPSVITNALDKLTILVQQALDSITRSLKLPVSTPSGVSTTLPLPSSNKLIGWNQDADGLQNVDPTTLATIVAFGTANADVFDGDGVTTQFNLSANPAALNNLDVSIGGVTQTPGVDYTWTSGTVITFTSAPPVGTDNVLVRYMQALPQGYTDSAASDFVQSGTGAVTRNVQDRLRDSVNVFDFFTSEQITDCRDGTGSLDVTTAVQFAENYASSVGNALCFPAGAYLITDVISRATGSQWIGEHRNKGLPGFINGTKIKFQPTSAKSLWVPSGAPSSYRVGYATIGFHIEGNSASAAGNSIYAFDVHGINKSVFEDLTITGFRYGFRCYATINNSFNRVAINNTYIASILYDGGVSTTDVWNEHYAANSPIWVQTNGSNIGHRFNNPTVESITTYGMNIVRESNGFEVVSPYFEDVPSANVATNALFRVGYDGTTLVGATQLVVTGGLLGGRNAGGVGSAFDIDYTDGVIVGGFHVTRYTNVIKTTSNTQTYQVISNGFTCGSVSTIVTDDTKVVGEFPLTAFNGGSRNRQTSRTIGDQYSAASAPCTGAITTSSGWGLTATGGVVTLKLPNVTGTATAAPSFTFGTAIPVKYRPSASLAWPCFIKDNNANVATPGMLMVDYLTGNITLYKDGTGVANFTNAATAGLAQGAGISVSWTI